MLVSTRWLSVAIETDDKCPTFQKIYMSKSNYTYYTFTVSIYTPCVRYWVVLCARYRTKTLNIEWVCKLLGIRPIIPNLCQLEVKVQEKDQFLSILLQATELYFSHFQKDLKLGSTLIIKIFVTLKRAELLIVLWLPDHHSITVRFNWYISFTFIHNFINY